MFFRCTASQLRGAAAIPGSKSHTIRAVVIAALADGESVIEAPLLSADAQSAAACAAQLGAEVDMSDGGVWRVRGFGSVPRPKSDVLDTGNSGTTMNILLAIPTSVLGTFIVIYFLGFTLNTFTVLGLSLAIGIIVDDAIMVLENITRHRCFVW